MMNMKTIRPILLLLLLSVVVPSYTYSQNAVKIKPAYSGAGDSTLPYPLVKWGYKDLQNNWLIPPQFVKAHSFNEDGIAEVAIHKPAGKALIDLNGNILTNYKSDASQKQKDNKYAKAIKTVSTRKTAGAYDAVYVRLAQIDADILAQQQREQALQDSILMAKRLLKMQADSIAMAKRIADSITVAEKRRVDSLRLAKEREITENSSLVAGLSPNKVKVTGHGLLLSKDKTWREYTIRLDDFNRLLITYEGDTRVRGELDVLKVIYESDWGLLSDDLFHSVEIVKATTEISQGARTKKFGVFSFLFTLNLDDLDKVFTDEETLLTVQNSISQIEKYITSFINHYKGTSHFVEPLFQMHPNDRTGISVGIVEKQGNREGIEIGNAKRMCAEAKRKLSGQRIN